jgi:hypothetical protein
MPFKIESLRHELFGQPALVDQAVIEQIAPRSVRRGAR